jgi:hypothetical protein
MSMRLVRASELEVVLLPGTADTALGIDKKLGPHTVVISGFIEARILAPSDDDVCRTDEFVVDIDEVLWQPTFLQASTMTSWGEIYSHDSDEVDHSRWGIRGVKTGHTDLVKGAPVRKIRIKMEIVTQGEMNEWRRIGFQTIANGTLSDVHDVNDSLNETEDIPFQYTGPPTLKPFGIGSK